MKKKTTQEEISFNLPDSVIYNFKTTSNRQNVVKYFYENFKLIFFLSAIFGSYTVLSLSILFFNNFSWFIPILFSSFMAVILRAIIGPINTSLTKNIQMIPQKTVEKVKVKEKIGKKNQIEKNISNVKCNFCGELTDKDPFKATLFCKSCGVEFTKKSPSSPVGITAKRKLQTESETPSVSNDTPVVMSEYLKFLKDTFNEEEKDFSQRKDSPEDLFLKKLDDVQKLLKLKQDKIRKFKKERKVVAETFAKKSYSPESETVKNVKFSCQACNKDYAGSIKSVNGSIFVVHEDEDLILQKTNSGYTFYYEHKVDTGTHQTFINLGKEFNVLSSEVIISENGLTTKKIKDTYTISDQEKFIPDLKYSCSLCKTDYKVRDYTKIKYESANHSTFVHIQTQHTNNGQHHLATLRIDLIDKMLVATPNVQLITPIQVQEDTNEHEGEEESNESEKQIGVTA